MSATLTSRRTVTRAARPARGTRPRAAIMGAAALTFAAAAIVALHVLRPGLDPGKYAISQYAAGGPYAWLATLALVALGGGALAVASALRAGGIASRAWLLVGVFGIGVLVAAAFPITPPGKGVDASEQIHGAAAFFAFASLTIAMLLYARAFRRNPRFDSLAGPTKIGGLVALIMLLGGALVVPGARGAVERIYLGILIAWLLAVALKLARATSRR